MTTDTSALEALREIRVIEGMIDLEREAFADAWTALDRVRIRRSIRALEAQLQKLHLSTGKDTMTDVGGGVG